MRIRSELWRWYRIHLEPQCLKNVRAAMYRKRHGLKKTVLTPEQWAKAHEASRAFYEKYPELRKSYKPNGNDGTETTE